MKLVRAIANAAMTNAKPTKPLIAMWTPNHHRLSVIALAYLGTRMPIGKHSIVASAPKVTCSRSILARLSVSLGRPLAVPGPTAAPVPPEPTGVVSPFLPSGVMSARYPVPNALCIAMLALGLLRPGFLGEYAQMISV